MLLFIDNIFRFVQAGSEVSALLGRMPSAVGYQPTLATEMGQLQERITSTRTGSVTSVQAIYVPADDLTDPAPGEHVRAPRRVRSCSRARSSEKGIYPAIDPLDSSSRALQPDVVCDEHYDDRDARAGDAPALQGPPGHHRDPRHGRALRRGQARRVSARARSSASSRSRSSSPRRSPARRASTCKLEDTIRASARSSRASTTSCTEQAFYMVGTIEEAVEKARSARIAGEPGVSSASQPVADASSVRGSSLARHARGRGVRGRGRDAHRPRRGRRDRRARASRAARRDAEGGRDARPSRLRRDVDEFATGPGSSRSSRTARSRSSTMPWRAKEIDAERRTAPARGGAGGARADRERRVDAPTAGSVEQRIVHAREPARRRDGQRRISIVCSAPASNRGS